MWLSSPRALCAELRKDLEGVWSILEALVALEGVAKTLEGVAKARRGGRLESQRADHKPSIMLKCFTGLPFIFDFHVNSKLHIYLVNFRQPYIDSAPLGSSWAPGKKVDFQNIADEISDNCHLERKGGILVF